MKKIRRICKTIILALASVLLLSGCAGRKGADDVEDIYNSVTGQSTESENYIFYSIDDTEGESLSFCNKKTGVTEKLVKNLFKADWSVDDSMFKNGKYIYYMIFTKDFSERGLYKAFDKFKVIELNTENFNSKIIYEANANSQKKHFLGLQTSEDSNAAFYQEITDFFLDNKNIYFLTQDQVWQVDRVTGKKKSIIDFSPGKNVAYSGRNIYYINDSLQIVQYNIETKESKMISDVATEYFFVADSKLYFTNRRDGNKLYSYDMTDKRTEKITDQSVSSFICDKQYIFYLDNKEYYLYRIDKNGSNEKVALEEAVIGFYLFSDYEKIYISLVSDNKKIILNKVTLKVES